MYFADFYNHRIRKISAATGNVITFAGTGQFGNPGDNVAALSMSMKYRSAVAVDTLGNVFSDSNNFRIRKIDAISAIVSIVAGTGSFGFSDGPALTVAKMKNCTSLWVDSNGTVFFTDIVNSCA